MAKKRLHTTLSEELTDKANAIMRHRSFDTWTEFLSSLIREEWDRRFLVAPTAPYQSALNPLDANLHHFPEPPRKKNGNHKKGT